MTPRHWAGCFFIPWTERADSDKPILRKVHPPSGHVVWVRTGGRAAATSCRGPSHRVHLHPGKKSGRRTEREPYPYVRAQATRDREPTARGAASDDYWTCRVHGPVWRVERARCAQQANREVASGALSRMLNQQQTQTVRVGAGDRGSVGVRPVKSFDHDQAF
jgi:hypothetical protein